MMWFRRNRREKRSKKDQKDDILRDNHDDELVDEVTDDNMAPGKKKSQFWDIFTSANNHRKIEHFMLQLGIATGLVVVGGGVSLYHHYRVSQEQSNVLNSYNTNVTFSQSKVDMYLNFPSLSASKKTFYLPVQFSDMTKLPGSADHLSLFLSATNGTLNYKPYGQIILYGSTGYGMIILHSNTGFSNQPVTLYLKNNIDYTGNAFGLSQSDGDVKRVQQKYDVLVAKLNLGNPGIVVDKSLPDGNAKPDLLFNTLFATSQRASIANNITQTNLFIKNTQLKWQQVAEKLLEYGYDVPAQPDYLKNNWRPPMQVDPMTGQIGGTKHYVADDGTNPAYLTTPHAQVPSTLYLKNSRKTVKSGTPAAQQTFQQLQNYWRQIYNAKYQIYVTDYAKLYSIKQAVLKNGAAYSVSSPTNFTILGPISVK